MSRSKGQSGTKMKEADIRKAEGFCSIAALIVIVLCFLFASGILQNNWVLSFIQMFGALMNLSALLVAVLRKNAVPGVLCLLLLTVQAVSTIYCFI